MLAGFCGTAKGGLMGERVRIKKGWGDEGREGIRLTDDLDHPELRQRWTPVLWDGEDEPSLFKSAGLEGVRPVLVLSCVGPGSGVVVRVDEKTKQAGLEGILGSKTRRIMFPMFLVADVCAIMLRECGVSTFRWSRKTRSHRVSMVKGRCVSEVTIARF